MGTLILIIIGIILCIACYYSSKMAIEESERNIYVYPKTGNQYKVLFRCKMKLPVERTWIDAVIYMSLKDDNFYVEIKVKDSDVYNRTLEILQKLKKEGSIEDKFFRANASIQMPDAGNLSAYTKQMLTQNALKRAYESLFRVLRSNDIDVNRAVQLTNEAYILEESYSSNEYNVVVETILE